MPKLNDPSLDTKKLTGSHYGYSATTIENLGATEYTLATILVDVSISVQGFKNELEKCIQSIVEACKSSPRANNLLIRLIAFSSNIEEIHGFKMLDNCKSDDYKNILNIHGSTALFDASKNAILATNDYAKSLYDNDFSVNGIVFILTDGGDNESTSTSKNVKDAIDKCGSDEKLESLITVLVGVGVGKYSTTTTYLSDFQKDAVLSQYVEIDKTDANTFVKLAGFVSKSISLQSKSLGVLSSSQPCLLDI